MNKFFIVSILALLLCGCYKDITPANKKPVAEKHTSNELVVKKEPDLDFLKNRRNNYVKRVKKTIEGMFNEFECGHSHKTEVFYKNDVLHIKNSRHSNFIGEKFYERDFDCKDDHLSARNPDYLKMIELRFKQIRIYGQYNTPVYVYDFRENGTNLIGELCELAWHLSYE